MCKEKIVYYNVKEPPFSVGGFYWFDEEKLFNRLPLSCIDSFNQDISVLARNTSGGNIRFKTNSKNISIKAKLNSVNHMPHMPRTGHSSFDFYMVNSDGSRKFKAIAMAPVDSVDINLDVITNLEGVETEWVIFFPLYNGVDEVEIGIDEGSLIYEPTPYSVKKPVVFYGSSITQGGCASRSGNSYTNILSNMLNANVLNFGFSGSARGEELMANTLASLDASCYVIDYDHNAPNKEHLANTHENFFKIIRNKNRDVPVVFMSKPDVDLFSQEDRLRRDIIYKTYENAKKANDNNVYFIDGKELFKDSCRDLCTVDGVHPNDLGFYFISLRVYEELNKIFS